MLANPIWEIEPLSFFEKSAEEMGVVLSLVRTGAISKKQTRLRALGYIAVGSST
jgi:hypothetical protein